MSNQHSYNSFNLRLRQMKTTIEEIKQVPDFRVGDEVWDAVVFPGVSGEVVELERSGVEVFRVRVKIPSTGCLISYFRDGSYLLNNFHINTPTLSHTKYDLVNGGFSQRMKLPEIPKGTLIYVRDSDSQMWTMRFFSHWDGSTPCCFRDQRKIGISSWLQWRLTNPYSQFEFKPTQL